MSQTYSLSMERQHLFVTLPSGKWLVDTGAPRSMGTGPTVTVAGVTVPLQSSYLGASVKKLVRLVGVEFVGLLGMDLLGRLDAVFDLPGGTVTFSPQPDLELPGAQVGMRTHGVPCVTGWVRGRPRPWWLDTGAKLSYFNPQEDDLSVLPFAGKDEDFFPVVGRYTVETYRVPVTLGDTPQVVKLKAAVPHKLLGAMLSQLGGLVGSELFVGRRVGFFPLRGQLVLAEAA